MSEVGEGPKCPKTPYNSIYSDFEGNTDEKKKSLVCCEHGKPCIYTEKNMKKEEPDAYDNLMIVGGQMDKNNGEVIENRNDKLKELADRLREVEMKSAKKKVAKDKRNKKNKEENSEKKIKKQREMVKMDKILNDASDLTVDESGGRNDYADRNGMDELSKAMSFLKSEADVSISKKKNKQKKDNKDDNQMERSVSFSSESKNRRPKKKPEDEHSAPRKAKYAEEGQLTRSMYLGTVSKSVAEKSLEKTAGFGIYHQVEKFNNLDDLPATIKLFMVNKTDEGFRHDQIRKAVSPSGRTKFYMDRGEQSMMFKSLDELVSYYHVQSRIHPEEFQN